MSDLMLVDALLDDIKVLQGQVAYAEQQCAVTRGRLVEANKQIAELQVENSRLAQENADLKLGGEALREQLGLLTEEMVLWKNRTNEAFRAGGKIICELRAEIEKLNQECDHWMVTATRLQDLWFSDADPEEIPAFAGAFARYMRDKEGLSTNSR